MPMLRRNGTGRARSASSEIATVVPLKTTAEPACCIALRTAVVVRHVRLLPFLAPADDDEQRVVDRDAEPDQRDEELDDHRDVGDARERPDQQEGRRDRDERHQQRHDRHERAEDEDRGRAARRAPPSSVSEQDAGAAASLSPAEARSASSPVTSTGGAADGDAGERGLRLPGLGLAGVDAALGRDVDEREGGAAVVGDERPVAGRGVGRGPRLRQRRLDLRERRVELLADAGRVDGRALRERARRARSARRRRRCRRSRRAPRWSRTPRGPAR